MNKQANARSCFVCGVENDAGLGLRFYETETSPVRVSATYTVPRKFQGYPNIVHGGIIAAMLDEVASRAVMRGDPVRIVVTAKLNVRYRRPVPVELPLQLSGWVVEDKGRAITVAGEMRGPDGALLAEAEAVVMEVDPTVFGDIPLDEQDWRVYPDQDEKIDGGGA